MSKLEEKPKKQTEIGHWLVDEWAQVHVCPHGRTEVFTDGREKYAYCEDCDEVWNLRHTPADITPMTPEELRQAGR